MLRSNNAYISDEGPQETSRADGSYLPQVGVEEGLIYAPHLAAARLVVEQQPRNALS